MITKKEKEEERGKELETTTKKTEQARNRPAPRQSIDLLNIYHVYAVLEY